MRYAKAMRPALFAIAIEDAIARAKREDAILDVNREAGRISSITGLSRQVVAANLVDAGTEARLRMETSSLEEPA